MARKIRVRGHRFSDAPAMYMRRTKFDRSHVYKTTFDAGKLIPVFVDEVLPGDTTRMSINYFARLATPIKPIMDNIYLDWFFFFVPNRLVWEHWQNFCFEQEDPDDSTDYVIPTASVGMSDIGSTMNSAKAASASERQAKNAEHLAVSQIEKNVAEADSVRQSTHGTVLQNGILANDLNLREQTYEKRLGYELEKMNLELENLRLQGSYLSSGVLNNIASANRANSAAAFDNIQTEMAGMERDFYKNIESLTGAPRSVASGVGSTVKNFIGFLGGRYFGRR